MVYEIENAKYVLHYQELKEDYLRFCQMPDKEWKKQSVLWDVLHFCCVVGYLKEMNDEMLVSDLGIIHEIVHLAKGISGRPLQEIRDQFKEVMKLA
jgi:hypothetical protein